MDPILEELEGDAAVLNLMTVALSPRFSLSSETRSTQVAAGSDETAVRTRGAPAITLLLYLNHLITKKTVACFTGRTGNAKLVCSLSYSTATTSKSHAPNTATISISHRSNNTTISKSRDSNHFKAVARFTGHTGKLNWYSTAVLPTLTGMTVLPIQMGKVKCCPDTTLILFSSSNSILPWLISFCRQRGEGDERVNGDNAFLECFQFTADI